MALEIVPKVLVCLVFIRHLLATLKYFEHFGCVQSRKCKVFAWNVLVTNLLRFLVGSLIFLKHLIDLLYSCLEITFRHIILLLDIQVEILSFFLIFNYFNLLLRNENISIEIDIKSFANQVISQVSSDKWCKKDFAIDCSNRNRVVKNYSVILFLNFLNVCTRNFQLSLTEENVRWVESWVEKYSICCYVKTTRNNDIVTKATRVITYVFLSLFEICILLDKVLIVFAERFWIYFSRALFFYRTYKLFFLGTWNCIVFFEVLQWFFYFFKLINFINLWIKLYLQIFMHYRLIKAVLVRPRTFVFLALRLLHPLLHKNCCEFIKLQLIFFVKNGFIVLMLWIFVQKCLNQTLDFCWRKFKLFMKTIDQ